MFWATGAQEPFHFCWGDGCVAPRLSHALFPPGLLFFFLSLSLSLSSVCLAFGARSTTDPSLALTYRVNRQCRKRNKPRIPRNSPAGVWVFLICFRGKCCPFFCRSFFRRLSLLFWRFFQSSTRLRFFSRKVFRNELWNNYWCPESFGDFFGPKKPHFRSRKRPEKSSPCFSFFLLEFYFCYAVVLGGFWA